MLPLNLVRENPQLVTEKLRVRNIDVSELISIIIEADTERRRLITLSENLQAEINSISKNIGSLMKEGKKEIAEEIKEQTRINKEKIKKLTGQLSGIDDKLYSALVQIPNIPHESVPPGKTANDNLLVREGGEMPNLGNTAKAHWDLIKEHNIIDFDLGVKITGAGFPVYRGKGARLQRALINYFLEEGLKAGYEEIQPPVLVNEASGFGTGQLPDKDGQMYLATEDSLYLIPTAEVPVTNIYRDRILEEAELPVKNMAYTPCFRREAGSWGADVRGLNRLHQFDKVEIVQITTPETSWPALEEMAGHVENLIKNLGLPYRVVTLCGGDISFTAAKTYDFEVYSAAQKKWLEVSSVSNFGSFQSNRLRCRYRATGSRETQLTHTLNGSALALPRIVAALLENNQKGSNIIIPQVLIPYTGFSEI